MMAFDATIVTTRRAQHRGCNGMDGRVLVNHSKL